MRISRVAVAAGAALTAAGALTAAIPAAAAPAPALRRACPVTHPGAPRCLTLYAPQTAVNQAIAEKAAGKPVPTASTAPKGWGATSIEAAYKLPVTRGAGQTVAIVDAYSTPHLASDLAFYRKHYGLPPCSAASGCLKIVNQQGKASPLPEPDPTGWGVEETLDVAMVSAACPRCKILLVESKSASLANLAAAEDTAARLGAPVISNSYGAYETGFSQAYASAYHHPGHTIVASSGDFGFTAAAFPANLATVTAVGGTQLARASSARGWAERVWDTPRYGVASGSGCSAYAAKPGWQHDLHCPGRTVADVAALAWDIAIYDSSLIPYGGPWVTIGGTSASAPLIAGVYALAGNAATITPGHPYRHPGALFDITQGNNEVLTSGGGAVCGYDYLCSAKKGYDAPTGLGSPDGIGAF